MSVPDSEQLIKIAVILETTVSELLGTQVENEEEPNQLAKELSRINTPRPMVSDGKLRVDAGQFFCQPVRFFFVFHLGSKKLAYGRFENDGNFYQLFRIKNRHSGFP